MSQFPNVRQQKIKSTTVESKIMPPKDVHVLIPKNCDYLKLNGKGELRLVIN